MPTFFPLQNKHIISVNTLGMQLLPCLKCMSFACHEEKQLTEGINQSFILEIGLSSKQILFGCAQGDVEHVIFHTPNLAHFFQELGIKPSLMYCFLNTIMSPIASSLKTALRGKEGQCLYCFDEEKGINHLCESFNTFFFFNLTLFYQNKLKNNGSWKWI